MKRIALAIALILMPFGAGAQEEIIVPECKEKPCLTVPYVVCLGRGDHTARNMERAFCDGVAEKAGYVHGVLRPGCPEGLKCLLCSDGKELDETVLYQCVGVPPQSEPTK